MGKSITPTFIVRYRDQQGPKILVWNTKSYGKPTLCALAQWRMMMNKSMKPGGCNEHLSRSAGYIIHISNCEIVNQKKNTTVVSLTAPMFEEV